MTVCINESRKYILLCRDEVIFTEKYEIEDAEKILEDNLDIQGLNLLLFNSKLANQKENFLVWNLEEKEKLDDKIFWNMACMLQRKEELQSFLAKNIDKEGNITNPNQFSELFRESIISSSRKKIASFYNKKAIYFTIDQERAGLDVSTSIKKAGEHILADSYINGSEILDIKRIAKKVNNTNNGNIKNFGGENLFILKSGHADNSSFSQYKQMSLKKNFLREKAEYIKLQGKEKSLPFVVNDLYDYPCLYDKYEKAGQLDSHYFLQDIYVAREINNICPNEHFDIGSRVDGFISHLLSFRKKITMIDIRPLPYKIDGLRFLQSDATKLENIPDNSIESLSSLHAVEHFGLGRYGDQINPEAWRTAILSMQRVVKTDGKLYLSVPIGTENRLYFNAHRMFEIHMIPTVLTEMELEKFVYIDNFEIIEILPSSFADAQIQKDYLCGIYVFRKRRCENRGK